MNREPLFSIVIPTYNRSEFILGAIDSCLNQTYSNFEVIVVDDGSTDDTKNKVEEIIDNRIRYYFKENGERGAARNMGILKSEGDFILFLDSDDALKKHCLNEYLQVIREHNPNVIFSNFNFNENGNFRNSDVANWRSGWFKGNVFLEGNYFASMICFKRSHRPTILFNESLEVVTSEDWIFNIQKTYHSDFYFISKVCAIINEHANRSMNLDQSKIIRTKINAMKKIKTSLDLVGIEARLIESHTNYFSAIHSYVAGNRQEGFNYLKDAKLISLRKRISLTLKLLFGRKFLLNFK